MKQFGLPKSRRLRSGPDFVRVYEVRQRLGDEHLLVFAAVNHLGRTRIGLSVSRKHGNAVERARLKRLLREAFRLAQQNVPPGLDLILIPRQNSGAGLADYHRSITSITVRLARRLGLATGT